MKHWEQVNEWEEHYKRGKLLVSRSATDGKVTVDVLFSDIGYVLNEYTGPRFWPFTMIAGWQARRLLRMYVTAGGQKLEWN